MVSPPRSSPSLAAGYVLGIKATSDRLSSLSQLLAALPAEFPAAIWLAIELVEGEEATVLNQLAAATALPLEQATTPAASGPGRVSYVPITLPAMGTADSQRFWTQLRHGTQRGDRLLALCFAPMSAPDQQALQRIRQAGGMALVVPPTADMGAIAHTLITFVQCAVPLPPADPAAPPPLPPAAAIAPPNEVELLYEQSPIGLALVDRDLRYIRANDMLGRIHGYESAAGYIGRRVDEVVPHLAATILPFYQQVLATQEPLLNVEVRCPSYINPEIESTYLVSYHPVRQADGRLCGISVSAVDVTELRRAEDLLAQHNRSLAAQVSDRTAALQRSEDSFRMALRSSRMVGWQRNLETGEVWHFGTFGNGGVWEATDWHLASAAFTVHPADAAWVEQAVEAAIAHRSELAIEYRLLFPDHSIAWVLSRGQVMRAAGKATHLFGVMLDITPRKQAELALVESEQRFQSLAANLPGIIFRYLRQPDGTEAFTYVSPNSAEIWELDANAVQANRELVWQQIDPSDLAAMQASIDTSATTLQPWQLEWRITTPSGRRKWLQGISRPHQRADGTIAWDGLIIDVSDRKAAEAALRQSEATSQAIVRGIPDLLLRMDGHSGRYLQVFKREGIRVIRPTTLCVGASIFDNLPPALAQERLHYMQQALATNTLQVYEYALPFTDETRYEEARIVPMENDTVLLFVRDITDRKRAEIALHEQEAYFRSLFDQASVGIAVCDRAGQLLRVNQRYCQLVGYTEAELLGRSYEEITHPADRDRYQQAMRSLAAGDRRDFSLEKRYCRKDAAVVWTQITCSAIYNEQGQHVLTLGIVQDISERKQAIAALKLSEQRFRAIFEHAAIGVVIEGPPDYRLSLANASYLRLVGYTSEELRQLTYRDITVAADLARQEVLIEECRAGRRSGYQIEKRYIRKDGCQIWVNMTTSIVRDDSGDIAYYISVVEDITERKRAIDLEISRHQELKTAIFEESNDAILLVDPDTRCIVDCNRRAIALFAADHKAALLRRTDNSLRQHPLPPNELAEHWQHILIAAVWQGELEFRTLTGQSFWGLLSAKLLQVAEQRIVLMQITDISDRKQVELDMRRNMETLQRLNQSKDDFLSTVSHELRSPLASIAMAGRMIQIALEQHQVLPATAYPPASEKLQHYLDILQAQCKRERELVSDLLDLQRLNADAYDLAMSTIDVPQWLTELTRDVVEQAQENQQQFELAIAPDVTTLCTDVAVLRRILSELLHNACKYTPAQERIQLTVTTLTTGLRFIVLNTGITLAAADQEQIFEPFFRATQGDRWSQRGTGLGLTLVKKFVTCLRGTIQVESDATAIRFIVDLPG